MKLYWLVSVAYCAEKFTPPKARSKGEVCFGLAAGIAAQMEKTRKVCLKFSRYLYDFATFMCVQVYRIYLGQTFGSRFTEQ